MRAFFVFFFLFSSLYSTAQESIFVLVREDQPVQIFERWIVLPNSTTKAREVKGEFEVTSTLAEAIRLLQDERRIQQWQKHVSEFKVYPTTDSMRWREYSYHDIPWPVSDQDHFLEYRFDPTSTADRIIIHFESVTDAKVAPERDGVTRLKLRGSWEFSRAGDKKIKAVYRIISTPLNIPRMITDPVIRNNMMNTIRNYIGILQEE